MCCFVPPHPPPSFLALLKPLLVPRVVAVSPQMRLVEDNPSSLSLVEIYKQRCAKKGIEHDNPISRYYDRLATVQARGTQASHQVWEYLMSCTPDFFLRALLHGVQCCPIRYVTNISHRSGGLNLFVCFTSCIFGSSYSSLVF